jgi:hypothetical protein
MNKDAFAFKEDKVILTKPYELSEEDWTVLTNQFNRLGYGLHDVDMAIDVYERLTVEGQNAGRPGYILQPDQADVIRGLVGDLVKDEISKTEIDDASSQAEEYYGVTEDYNLAGYLTTNGKFLDFSEGQGMRTLDHRGINQVIDIEDRKSINDEMNLFMNYGNIRIISGGIDLIKEPNLLQRQALRDFIDYYDGEIMVDYTNEEGKTVGSTVYGMGTDSERILNDISSYFRTYEVPENYNEYEYEYE